MEKRLNERNFIAKSPRERTVEALLQIVGSENDRVKRVGGQKFGGEDRITCKFLPNGNQAAPTLTALIERGQEHQPS